MKNLMILVAMMLTVVNCSPASELGSNGGNGNNGGDIVDPTPPINPDDNIDLTPIGPSDPIEPPVVDPTPPVDPDDNIDWTPIEPSKPIPPVVDNSDLTLYTVTPGVVKQKLSHENVEYKVLKMQQYKDAILYMLELRGNTVSFKFEYDPNSLDIHAVGIDKENREYTFYIKLSK